MILPRPVLQDIVSGLERAYPREGCGFLVGTAVERVAVRCQLPARNAREDGGAERRYLISPEEFVAAARQAAAAGLEVIGVYHSHPDVAPLPSEYDREHAWPWYHYLIVSVVRGAAGEMRAWQLADDRSGFVEREVRIVE